MITNRSKGFTLIELLVVIAIIGVLSAVVLASLNSARSKGNDASVKANLNTVRTQAAIYYDSTTTPRYLVSGYAASGNIASTNCQDNNGFLADSTISNALTQANKAAGGANNRGSFVNTTVDRVGCGWSASPASWVIVASTTGGNWCIDSAGVSKQVNTGSYPNTTTYLCP
jgi:type IV pilus assembly protein PilA/prepilin peptidase dependent protein D